MTSLLFKGDDDLIFSELLQDGTISVIITDHGDQLADTFSETKLDIDDIKSLVEWLNKQIAKREAIDA